jgi:hypothetical protein
VAFEGPELEVDELFDAVPDVDDVLELVLTVEPELVLDAGVAVELELLLELEPVPFWKWIVPVVVGLMPWGVQLMASPERHDA